jgi:hypothetical protein
MKNLLLNIRTLKEKNKKCILIDNPTRKFLTNRIAAFFKFEPIKLIYSEKTPSRVKKQLVVFQRKNLCQNETSNENYTSRRRRRKN